MRRRDEVAFVVNKESSTHDPFDGYLFLAIGLRSTGHWDDGQLHIVNGLKKLSLSTQEIRKAHQDAGEYPTTGYVRVDNSIPSDCHIYELQDAVSLTCKPIHGSQ